MARNNVADKCTSTAVLVDPEDRSVVRLSEYFLPAARLFDFLEGDGLSPCIAEEFLDRHLLNHKRCQHSAKAAILIERDGALQS